MQAVFNALNKMPCDICFAYPIAKIFFPVYLYSYTHYPIVSSDMIETVKKGEA